MFFETFFKTNIEFYQPFKAIIPERSVSVKDTKSSFPSISQLVEPFRSNVFDSANNILTAEEEDELLYGDNIDMNTVDSVFINEKDSFRKLFECQ